MKNQKEKKRMRITQEKEENDDKKGKRMTKTGEKQRKKGMTKMERKIITKWQNPIFHCAI